MKLNKDFLHELRAISAVLILVALSGCYGGIFGTGDGTTDDALPEQSGDIGDETPGGTGTTGGTDADSSSDTGSTEEADAGSDGGTTGDLDGGSDGATDGSTDGGTESDGGSSLSPAPLPFENTSPSTSRSDALIVVVNASELSLLVTTTSGGESPMPLELISTQDFSSHVALDPALTHSISFYDASHSTTDPRFELIPVTLSAGSVSTLVTRNIGDSLDVVPLVTQTTSTDATLTRLRLIQTDELGGTQQTANFSVDSAGSNPGGGEHTFSGISYDNPVGDYVELPAGDYVLSDSLGRFSSQSMTLIAGTSVTILVNGMEPEPVIVFNDSQLSFSQ